MENSEWKEDKSHNTVRKLAQSTLHHLSANAIKTTDSKHTATETQKH